MEALKDFILNIDYIYFNIEVDATNFMNSFGHHFSDIFHFHIPV